MRTSKTLRITRRGTLVLGVWLAAASAMCPTAHGQATMDAPDLSGKTSNERFRHGAMQDPGISAEAAARPQETDAVFARPTNPAPPGRNLGALLPYLTLVFGLSTIGVAMYMKKSRPE